MHFRSLSYLDSHISSVGAFVHDHQLFVVGGAVRDLLLGVNTEPHDIDITLAGDPDEIYKKLQKAPAKHFSLFRTEKFGTVTLINNSQSKIYNNGGKEENITEENGGKHSNIQNPFTKINYELTPFREEGGYDDHRHPSEIERSKSLIGDAKRRDFTINCLYYTSVQITNHKSQSRIHNDGGKEENITEENGGKHSNIQNPKSKIHNPVDHDEITLALSKQGRCYLANESLLIVQDNELIESLFKKGKFQSDRFTARAEEQHIHISEEGTMRFLLDPCDGVSDLLSGTLRAVGDAEKRFHEDALRILRSVRLVNMLNQKLPKGNFDFEKETWNAMKKLSPLVRGLAKERIHQEIVKVFSGKNPFGRVAIVDELGLGEFLFPALRENKHDDQPVRYHPFDTYTHTLLTLWHLQEINENYLVKLGMLYHDVGKKDQYAAYGLATTKEEQQNIHKSEANHIISGPVFVERDFRALGFSNKEIEEVQLYVAQHMRPGQILMARPDNMKKRMRQLLSEYGYEKVKNLLDITLADRRGQYNPLQGKEAESVQLLYELLDELNNEEGQFTMHHLAINGEDIMNEFQLSPGPHIKKYLREAFERVLSDISHRNTKENILIYLHSLSI